MDKEKILSKITARDYYNELEKILEDKDFSEDVKNLLLSCVYKIEAGYKDYEIVKRMVEPKKDYLEQILRIIKDKCQKIEIIKQNSLEDLATKKYEVDKLEGNISLWHPNEITLLYAIYEMDDHPIYFDEKYSLVRISLSELINKGENINNLEVLRDFNGWNWNIQSNEIQDISINLVYQNLIYLLGINLLKQWVYTEDRKDYLQVAKEKLKEAYGLENANEFLEYMNEISIICCVEYNEKERIRLLEEKQELQKEWERLTNKTELLNEISKTKKELLGKIKEIDQILNDKRLLEKEYIERNEKLPEYNKIFSLAHLTEILTKQRKKLLAKIEEGNKILEPQHYIQAKNEIEKKLMLLGNVDLGEEKEKRKLSHQIKLQQIMMKCLKIQLENAKEKTEIMNLIYMFRYYFYLNISKEKTIGEEKNLQKQKETLQKEMLQKAIQEKVIAKVVKDEELNFKILQYIFENKVINLENLSMEIKQDENLVVRFFDSDILEKEQILDPIDKKEILVKQNKKIKLWIG